MSIEIHPTSIVDKAAEIGEGVYIGPYCIVGPKVKIGKGTKLHSHVVVDGNTSIGEGNEIYNFCTIGAAPQDKTYSGEDTKTIIGDNNLFREGVTVHRATTKEKWETIVGSNNYFMAHVHIAHDCIIGNHITLANSTMCAGHVKLGDYITMGGTCGVAPFCSVATGAFIGAASAIDKDIPQFCYALGNRIKMKGVNIIGMRRRGYSRDIISEVIDFYRMMEASALSSKAYVDHPENIEVYKNNKLIMEIVEFISKSEIGLPPYVS